MFVGAILNNEQWGAGIGEELECNCEDRDAAKICCISGTYNKEFLYP